MFSRTASLQKRAETRLWGFRTPSIRILREALSGIDRAAFAQPYQVPHVEPPKGLPLLEAWKHLRLPMASIMQHQLSKNTRLKAMNSLRLHKNDTFINGTASALAVDASALPLETIHQRSHGKTNPPRYKPPATSYWAHSIYRYNQNSIKLLPVTSINTGTLLHTHMNMLPSGYEDIIEKSHQNTKNLPNLFRAFVSDKAISKRIIKQDLMGKLSHRKASFLRPFRRLMDLQPRLVFKHYPRETRIMALVYDRRVEVLKQRLNRLSRLLRKDTRRKDRL